MARELQVKNPCSDGGGSEVPQVGVRMRKGETLTGWCGGFAVHIEEQFLSSGDGTQQYGGPSPSNSD